MNRSIGSPCFVLDENAVCVAYCVDIKAGESVRYASLVWQLLRCVPHHQTLN
jgi:hypothetical protein